MVVDTDGYANRLLGDRYRPILMKRLKRHKGMVPLFVYGEGCASGTQYFKVFNDSLKEESEHVLELLKKQWKHIIGSPETTGFVVFRVPDVREKTKLTLLKILQKNDRDGRMGGLYCAMYNIIEVLELSLDKTDDYRKETRMLYIRIDAESG